MRKFISVVISLPYRNGKTRTGSTDRGGSRQRSNQISKECKHIGKGMQGSGGRGLARRREGRSKKGREEAKGRKKKIKSKGKARKKRIGRTG